MPLQPPPRGQPAHEPPEVNPPVPVQDKATCFTEIAMHVNHGVTDLCRKTQPFAGNRWHPQHRNKSCLFTTIIITRGHFDIPPPDPNDPLGGYVLYNWTLSHPNMPTQTGGNNTTPTVTNINLAANGTGTYNFTVDFVWNANTSCTATSSVNIVTGCVINSNSPNYDSAVQIDDGSCIAPAITGCTDPAADNYDPVATQDDGTCTYPANSGCMDPTACNYDPTATVDDGSCTYSSDDGGGAVGSPPPRDEDATDCLLYTSDAADE